MPISDAIFTGSVNVIRSPLRQTFYRTICETRSQRQGHVLPKSDVVSNVAVLGGGITGLASAYYLSRRLPKAKIVLFERSSRLGGWVHSKKVEVANGKVVFEQGPRSLRPSTASALVTLDLVSELGLEPRLLTTSKKSAAAQNRFVYYPDHLVRLPGPGSSLLGVLFSCISEPVFKGVFPSLLTEPHIPPRPDHLLDESVASFLSRRLGSSLVADNIVSAVFHGIYAGDIYQLSARSLLARAWQFERRYGSLFNAFWSQARGRLLVPISREDVALCKETRKFTMKDASTFTFMGGIGELANTILAKLEDNPNVEIRKENHITQLTLETNKVDPKVKIMSSLAISPSKRSVDETFSHAISTISGTALDKIANIPPLSLTPSVTVMVVNLYFPESEILPVRGFGYLIPRSVPYVQNPELALGVVFDSQASVGQDTVPGTKLTVMLGGHWWNGWDAYPDEDEGASMAKSVLKRHLGIDKEPQVIRVALQKDCIPQYTVGHEERMAEASLLLERFQGKLRVAGSSFTGVGLNDCVRAARDVVDGLVDGTSKTGLDSFVGGRKWLWMDSSPKLG